MNKTVRVLGVVVSALFLANCANFMNFEEKPLNGDAKGIAIVRDTPYNCMVRGSVEGFDSYSRIENQPVPEGRTHNFVRRDYQALRNSALNDVRNNAAAVIGETKKYMVLHIKEELGLCGTNNTDCSIELGLHQKLAVCGTNSRCISATEMENERQLALSATGIHIKADVFDCGKR